MSRLGILDQAMFKLEQCGLSPVHMCGAMILDTTDSPHPANGRIVADHMAACMEEIPLMRQRLVQDPLGVGDLRLVDEPHFDVRNHVTHSALAAPGGYDELTRALGDFSARPMDLTGPLWCCEVIEGLADGQLVIAIRIHHAIQDGSGAQRMLEKIWSPTPVPGRKPRSGAWQAAELPTSISLLTDALLENAQRLYIQTPSFLLNNIGAIFRTFSEFAARQLEAVEKRERVAGHKPLNVNKTSLNVAPISATRVVSYLELPLDDVRSLRKTFDCSVNDLVLLFNSCALAHYFAGIGEAIDFDLVAGMPVDVRSKGDVSVGNGLAFSRVNLQNTVVDIRERLRAIVEQTTLIKASTKPGPFPGVESNSGIDYKALGGLFSPLTLDVVIRVIARFNLMDKATFINVAIANVPGPQIPLYLAGAKLHSQVAMGPCADSLALNITSSSTDRYLVLGYHGCAEAIRDKELLVEGARLAFQRLMNLARARHSPAPGRVSTKKKAKSSVKIKADTAAVRQARHKNA